VREVRRIRLAVAAGVIVAGLSTAGTRVAAAPSAQRLEAIDTFVAAEMQRQKVPGVAIAVVGNDGVRLSRGYGYANVEHQVAVTPETIFQSGSVGKQFSAAAVMLQVEDGRLSVDDPIAKFIDCAPAAWRGITVRHLLTHTSGIPDYTEDASGGSGLVTGVDFRRDYTEQELVSIACNLPLDFAPGTRWSYSNTGYLLLGAIVRRASGEFYGDVLARRVFAPLGMKTARVISEADIVPHRAAGYQLVDGALKNQDWVASSLNTTADGALYLSLLDMIAWDRGLRAGAILTPQSWETVYTPVRLASGRTYPYGFGWSIDETPSGPWYHHGGSWQGFRTYISRYVGRGVTIVVLANSADSVPARFVDGIAQILDDDLPLVTPSKPIEDREPEVTARVRELLERGRSGQLARTDFTQTRTIDPTIGSRVAERLRPLGTLQRIELLRRRDLGDDREYTYVVTFEKQKLNLDVAFASDDRPAGIELYD
jgi:CubicO group peptidase (beta-lactamase class C family)